MSKTKIFVIHLKEIIYTALFVGLGILLIILLVIMFKNKVGSTPTMNTQKYTPGVWKSSLVLRDTTLELEVVLDKDKINDIRIINIDDAVTTMYPLMQPSLDTISKQLYDGVEIEDITFSEDSKYTEQILLKAVAATLEKAAPKEAEK